MLPKGFPDFFLTQFTFTTLNIFAGEISHAPVETRKLLEILIHPDHSICTTIVKGKTIVNVSQWPSWLNKGHKRHVETFNELFYAREYVECSECKLC